MKNDDIYFAGLFDGEGCVMIYKRIDPSGRSYYQCRCALAMIDREPVDRLLSVYGIGSVYSAGRPKLAIHQAWQWVAVAQHAATFFKHILPYSMTKKPEILLAMDFQAHIREFAGTKRLPKEVLDYRESCFLRMKALKHRFPLVNREST